MLKRRRTRRLISSVAMMMLACHENRAIEYLPSGPQSYLIGIESTATSLWAIDPKLDRPEVSAVDPKMQALAFDCRLGELGLAPGSLRLLDSPTELRLPTPSAGYEYDLESQRWQSIEPPPIEALARADLAPDHFCSITTPTFSAQGESFSFDPMIDGVSLSFAIAVRTEVIAGTETGQLYAMSPEGQQRKLPARRPFAAAFADASDNLWTVAVDGTVAYGDPSTGLEELSVKTSVSAFVRVGLDGTSDPVELFAAYDSRSLHRFDAAERVWTPLAVVPPEQFTESVQPSVAWISRGEALAVGATTSDDELYWHHGGRGESLRVPSCCGNARLVQRVPGIGTLLLTASGDVFVFDEGRFSHLAKARSAEFETTYRFISTPSGLILNRLGETPYAEIVVREGRVCALDVFATRVANHVALLGDDLFLAMRAYSPPVAYAAFVRLERATPDCLLP